MAQPSVFEQLRSLFASELKLGSARMHCLCGKGYAFFTVSLLLPPFLRIRDL